MWIDHTFEFTAEIFKDPVVKGGAYGNSTNLILKSPAKSITTNVQSGREQFFMGSYKCPAKPTAWTDSNCLPNWIKKGQKVLIKGRIDGRLKPGETKPSSYFINFSEVIPLNTAASFNKAVARGEIVGGGHIGEETAFLMKEAMKKMNPDDEQKYRYYRVLVNQKLDLGVFKNGAKPVFYGELGRDCLPVPQHIADALKVNPNDASAKYDACFAPLIVANEAYV